ncbi:type II secretion system protein [Tichowtungia aerotolerans]|uniref:type II secretion system protein n=1 Tax=Tichowtungia aerotolerans TaxID=2697043 RepID=UPI0022B90C8F|nr:prepilin-type N-terminal cleavage/methylation domain-containing protein [Tichowtungia aerotolerans]
MKRKQKAGFTLVELMIVAAIIAILAAIIIPLLSSNRDTAIAAEAHNLCGTVATACKVYYAKNGAGPTSTADLPATTQTELENAKYYDESDIEIDWTSPAAWTITVTSGANVYSTGTAEDLTLNQAGTWGGSLVTKGIAAAN